MDLSKTNYKALVPSEYITAADFDGKTPTMTITNIEMREMESVKKGKGKGEAKIQHRGVVFFKETTRGWVLNSTNNQCIAAMFGEIVGGWIGKRVTLCAELVRVGNGTEEPGIRVKGSPDLQHSVEVEIRLPRKRPVKRTLLATGRQSTTQSHAGA